MGITKTKENKTPVCEHCGYTVDFVVDRYVCLSCLFNLVEEKIEHIDRLYNDEEVDS